MPDTVTSTIQITVNGDSRRVPAGLSIRSLLMELNIDPERVAVEHNRRIARRPEWDRTPVQPGDQLEIVQFVGGG